jgi:predicted RNA-binding protein YlqC (UPF0109 family)
MKELVEFLAKNIVSDPKSVKLAESAQDSQQIIRLSVASGDMGKIIGKSGRIIKSIRTLLKIKAIKEGKRVYLELAEQEQ